MITIDNTPELILLKSPILVATDGAKLLYKIGTIKDADYGLIVESDDELNDLSVTPLTSILGVLNHTAYLDWAIFDPQYQ